MGTARRFVLSVGPERLEDRGTIFTSAFASSAEDASCDFIVTWLGQGKADSPSVGRAGRSGDAECRAMVDTHQVLKKLMLEHGNTAVSGWVAFHTSGVPCLSCVGIAAQFKRCYPGIAVSFTFAPRENNWDEPEIVATAPQGPRAAPSQAASVAESLDSKSMALARASNGGREVQQPAVLGMLDERRHPEVQRYMSDIRGDTGVASAAMNYSVSMANFAQDASSTTFTTVGQATRATPLAAQVPM